MKKYIASALGICTLAIVLLVSCNKINQATDMGQDLIPPVDNIHTFDTTLEVETYNGLFDPALDSFRSIYTQTKLLGVISNDPLFGKTDGRIFFQVSPGGRSPFKNRPGSLYLDSVVLVIDHSFTYGDTLTPQTIQVSEIDPSSDFRADSLYRINRLFTTSNVLGSKTFIPRSTSDSIRVINYPDTNNVVRQIRIKLDPAFGQRLLDYDSTGTNNAYASDSLFRIKFKGFALQSIGGGNGLMGVYLNDATTHLAVYYRYNNTATPTDIDTAVASFYFYNGANASSNYISRNYSGTQVLTGMGDQMKDPIVYMQNTPGTYTNIRIPGMAALPNCVVHLAELQAQSIYDVSDTIFTAPPNVFVDVYDSTAAKFKLIPSIFGTTPGTNEYLITNWERFYSSSSINQTFTNTTDPLGNRIKLWRFNITRYLQSIVSDKIPAYSMRMYAPAATTLPLGDLMPAIPDNMRVPSPQATFYGLAGVGRTRIGGGNHPTQKMKLRIVYSKI